VTVSMSLCLDYHGAGTKQQWLSVRKLAGPYGMVKSTVAAAQRLQRTAVGDPIARQSVVVVNVD
jgi:hypothetical protein